MSMESFPKPTPSQEQQEPTADKLEAGKKVFKFLDKTKFLEARQSDEQFDGWIQNLSYEDFSNYLTRLNGILREVPIKKRSVDGSGVEVSFGIMGDISYLPPAPEQKDELMRETFDALKEIPNNNDRALLSYYALQAIHPYSDGNGRTGRLLHELVSEEGKTLTEEKLAELLDHDKEGHSGTGEGRSSFAEKVLEPERAYYFINREVAKDVLGNDFVNENGSIYVAAASGVGFVPETVKEKLSPEEGVLVGKILGEADVSHFSFRGIVLAKLISEKPELQKYLYQSKNQLDERRGVVPEDIGKKFFSIDGEEIMPNLTEEDARRLIEIHEEVKEKFIRGMIDIFVHPEKHQVKNKEGDEFQVKDIFRKQK